jgi:hypothetical protein
LRNRKSRKEKSAKIGEKVVKIIVVGQHKQSASYSAAEAPRLLRVSNPTLKRMCATRDIPCFKTSGGYLCIPVNGLKSIQGKAGGSTTSTPSSVLQSRRERVEELNLEGQELTS